VLQGLVWKFATVIPPNSAFVLSPADIGLRGTESECVGTGGPESSGAGPGNNTEARPRYIAFNRNHFADAPVCGARGLLLTQAPPC
jgi:hypothetical protein